MGERTIRLISVISEGCLIALVSSAALAQQSQSGGVALSVNPETCRQLVTMVGDGAAYVPGKDVNGNDVVSAEGPATAGTASAADLAKLANTTTIYLGMDVAKRYGLTGPKQALSGDMPFGTITVQDGQPYINGKPIASGDDPAIVAACKKLMAQ